MNEKEELNNLNKQIKVLADAQTPLYNRRNKIQNKIDLEERQSHVGKCFMFINSSSEFKTKWNIYYKVLETTSYGFKVLSIETDPKGCFEILIREDSVNFYLNSCFKISIKRFETEFNTVFAKLKKLK